MSGFTLDTSGFVALRTTNGADQDFDLVWSDLDPLTQATLATASEEAMADPAFAAAFFNKHGLRALAFSDWSADALAAILKDCAAYREGFAPATWDARMKTNPTYFARNFWRDRQAGNFPALFPPRAITLGDDGLVHLREAAQ